MEKFLSFNKLSVQISVGVCAMEVINKLYSTVSSTVSQLSSVLPGNPVAKDFEVGEHIASAGPGTSSLFYLLYLFKRSTK